MYYLGANIDIYNLVTYEYKSGGNRLKSMEYANGAKQTLIYDRLGNVIGEKWTHGNTNEAEYRYSYDASQNLVKTLDIINKKMYNINRVGENVTSIEEYNVGYINTTTYTVYSPTLVGTMYYSFDSDGKQFRKKYIDADGNEHKYVFEYKDEQNVAVQLPTGVVSHSKSDHLGRKVFDELQLGKGLMNRKFTYHDGVISQAHLDNDKQVSTPETTLVKKIEFADGRTIEYEYDDEERITKVTDSIDGVYEYTYDAVGQLLAETVNDVTVNTMTYDKYGNITSKNGISYGYDTVWKDRLVSYNGYDISYKVDEIVDELVEKKLNGNPTSYLGTSATWEKGRQLKTFGANTYWYNKDGIRIKKQTATEIHEYTLDGTNIIKETVTDTANCPKYTNEYLYDLDGTVCGLKYNGVAYYFYKNLQGDVIAITDDTGETVARYTYDAWGKVLTVTDANGTAIADINHIANINPFRYRSYYYDTETGLYYLQSRYYDPEVGRFINADDSQAITVSSNITCNLFVYCNNSPVYDYDNLGNIGWNTLLKVLNYILDFIIKIARTAANMSKEMEDITKSIKKAKNRGASNDWIKQLTKKKKAITSTKKLGIGKLSIIVSLLGVFLTVFPYLSYIKKATNGIFLFAEFFVEIVIEIFGLLSNGMVSLVCKFIPYAGFILGWALGIVVDIILDSVFNTNRVNSIKHMYANRVKNTRNWKEWISSLGPCIKAAF